MHMEAYTGDGTWLYQAILDATLLCVLDGSYIRELQPDLCSTTIMMECSQGRGCLSLAFTDRSPFTNAFRGELLRLMAIHLLLHSLNITRPNLTGSVQIHSDCMGALQTLATLPDSRIPPTWKHADILKTIAMCRNKFSFARSFHPLKAHQDDHTEWMNLSWPSQLNCACDTAAKRCIMDYIEPHLSVSTPAGTFIPYGGHL